MGFDEKYWYKYFSRFAEKYLTVASSGSRQKPCVYLTCRNICPAIMGVTSRRISRKSRMNCSEKFK